MTRRGVCLEMSSGYVSVRMVCLRWIGGKKSPFAVCCSAAQRTELDRGRGPLMEEGVPLVEVVVTLLLLLLLLLSSRLRRP